MYKFNFSIDTPEKQKQYRNWKGNSLVKLLELYPNKPWNYDALSLNPNITYDIVLANPDKPWDYNALSQNKFLHNKTALRNAYEDGCQWKIGFGSREAPKNSAYRNAHAQRTYRRLFK